MLRRSLLALALSGLVAGVAHAETARPRAVIELFTSQGCSSCPPADKLMGEFTRDPTLVALTYAVQIWDHLGWRDTLATPENTRRQRGYARARGDRQVYTPQVVVDGTTHVVGSNRAAIDARCAGKGSTSLTVDVTLARDGDVLRVTTLGVAPAEATDVRVVLAVVERERTVPVANGENRGTSITYHNVVRELRDLGRWSGADQREIAWPAGGDTVAVLVQSWSTGNGPATILGASLLR
jgi:hypothetical protein